MRKGERWNRIVGWPNHIVSSEGRVSSKQDGGTRCYLQTLTASGYCGVGLYWRGKRAWPLVHRLVLRAFRGKCPPGMVCRHLNGNPADNRLRNLAWGTPKQNGEDRAEHARLGVPASKVIGRKTWENARRKRFPDEVRITT